MPLKQLPWRIRWMRQTSAYSIAPIPTSLRLLQWTAMELYKHRLSFRTQRFPFVTMPNNFCGLWSYVGREFENDLLSFVEKTLKPGQIFVDVGANIGIYSTHASAAVGLDGKVIAFEAHPVTAEVFRENAALNGLPNVRLINTAVGAEPGTLEMRYGRGDSGSSHVAVGPDRSTVTVPVIALDLKLSELELTRVDYLKVDVEGFELFVLRGALQTLSANPGIVVQTEIDRRHLARYGVVPADVFDFMRKLGFQPHKVWPDASLSPIDQADYGDVIWLHQAGSSSADDEGGTLQ